MLFTTGGTVASLEGENGLVPELHADDLLSYIPELNVRCRIDTKELMNIDSTNMQPEFWIDMANAIYEHYDQYDGFIITHGTDTMAYTSAALSYMLQDASKPIVITGSQIPISYSKTDAKRNISDAIRFACEDIGGVYIVFDGKVIQGTRAIKLRTKAMMPLKVLIIRMLHRCMMTILNIMNRFILKKETHSIRYITLYRCSG